MKESLEIRRLHHEDDVEELVFMHQDISVDNKLKEVLIYYDLNFLFFLKKSLLQTDEYFYGLFDKQALVGFIHFKIFDKTLFLNNFYIREMYRKGGAGRLFLKNVISNIKNDFEFFALDVIKSNKRAYEWYLRLGLQNLGMKEWIKIIPKINCEKQDLFIRKPDANGFDSVFLSETKVATIINNYNLILHDLSLSKEIGCFGFDVYACIEITVEVKSKFITLETVERLSGSFDVIAGRLNMPSYK